MPTCSSCGHELETRSCLACQGHNPVDAIYCCYCGKSLDGTQTETDSTATLNVDDPYDPENRILCSDDSCIGIINEKGVCTECGRPYERGK